MLGLLLAALMSGLDGSISTALPTIAHDFELGPDFVWFLNIYFLATAVVQLPQSQFADLWGRRWAFIGSVALFVAGSGIIGGAVSSTMLIAGRAVQGIGAGGINMMIDLIICDLVPLRERGNYIGMVFGSAIVIAGLGPLIGGALTSAGSWRWIFWLNFPIGGVCIGIMLAFLKVSSHQESDLNGQHSHERLHILVGKLQRVDWVGTVIITGSTTSSLWALAYGGSAKSWGSPDIIIALIFGFVGLAAFAAWEMCPWCRNPLVPPHLFGNRTSAIAFFLSFTDTALIYWVNYMLPIYLQAVPNLSPKQSGIWLLPFSLSFPVGAALSGFLLAKTGRYKPIHLASFALCALTCGLESILDSSTSKPALVVLEMILAVSVAAPSATTLSAVQAPLTEKETASSTGTWAFIRSLGSIWSVAIPAAIFNTRFSELLPIIEDSLARSALSNGQAYNHASSALVNTFKGQTRAQVIQVYTSSLQRTWQIGIAIAGISLVIALFEREIKLREAVDTEFGLEEVKPKDNMNP